MEEAVALLPAAAAQHPQAHRPVDYLKQRGLTGAIAKRFELGFAPPGWDNLLNGLGTDEPQARTA